MRGGKTIVWGGLASLSVGFSKGFEAMGDAAFAASDSGSALFWHLLALGLLVAAIFCGWKFFRALTGSLGRERDVERVASTLEEPTHRDSDSDFDPDEALKSYLAKHEAGLTRPVAPPPPTGGFGRRGL